jgi:hypothetical protein
MQKNKLTDNREEEVPSAARRRRPLLALGICAALGMVCPLSAMEIRRSPSPTPAEAQANPSPAESPSPEGTPVSAVSPAPEEVPAPAAAEKESPSEKIRWGITTPDSAYGLPRFEPRLRDTALKLLACAGVDSVRMGVNWTRVEPERGRMDFSDLIGRVDELAGYGISTPIAFLHGTPSWASGKTGERDLPEERKQKDPTKISWAFWPPKDWADWENFVENAVKTFSGRIEAWEILNEPDLWSEGFNGTYEDYKVYLQKGYEAAKRANPNCRVFVAGMVFDDKWLPKLLEDGWARYFDGVITHPYAKTGQGVAERNLRTAELLKSHGVERDIWVTEVGFQSGGWKAGPGVVDSEEAKAREGGIALRELAKQKCGLITWYSANERGDLYGLNRVEPNMALRPMPMYYEYGEVTGRLPRGGGPVRVEVETPTAPVARGERAEIVLRATNPTDKPLQVRLWPVGFIEALQPENEGPRAQDWEGELAPGESRTITVAIRPDAKAEGAYPLGLAVICGAGNSLEIKDFVVVPKS